jgi:hypothetical protein
MAVITRDIWSDMPVDPEEEADILTVPNADAYGLAVMVADETERTTIIPADFHDGTFVVQMSPLKLYIIGGGALLAVPSEVVWQ